MIRKAKLEDLEDILNIYHYAREYMKKNGNSTKVKVPDFTFAAIDYVGGDINIITK